MTDCCLGCRGLSRTVGRAAPCRSDAARKCGKPQPGSGDGQNGEGQIGDDVLEAAAERIAQKIDGECIGHIIEPDRPEQPPTPDTQCKLQAPDRKQRNEVDEDDGDPEENEDRPVRGSAYGTEPCDKPEMDKQRGDRKSVV